MLNVEGGGNVASSIEQLKHILVALRMTGARCVGVCQFVDNSETRMPGEDGREIHLLELCSAIFDLRSRHNRHSFQQRFGFLAAVRFHNSDYDLTSFGLFLPRRLKHGVGLPYPWRHTEKNLRLAPGGLRFVALQLREKC